MVLEAGKLPAEMRVEGRLADRRPHQKKSFFAEWSLCYRGVVLRRMGSPGHTSSQWRGGVCNPGLSPVTGSWLVGAREVGRPCVWVRMALSGRQTLCMGKDGPARPADPVYGYGWKGAVAPRLTRFIYPGHRWRPSGPGGTAKGPGGRPLPYGPW